ncbi:hypothetical protein [Nocardia sp. Marseille-Q1738]
MVRHQNGELIQDSGGERAVVVLIGEAVGDEEPDHRHVGWREQGEPRQQSRFTRPRLGPDPHIRLLTAAELGHIIEFVFPISQSVDGGEELAHL